MRKKGELIDMKLSVLFPFIKDQVLLAEKLRASNDALLKKYGEPKGATGIGAIEGGGGFQFVDKDKKPFEGVVDLSVDAGITLLARITYNSKLQDAAKEMIHQFIVKEQCEWRMDANYIIEILTVPVDLSLLHEKIEESMEN